MYTTAEVAAGFQVKPQTVQKWVDKGKLKYAAVANLRKDKLFDPEEVASFAAAHEMIFVQPERAVSN